MTTDKRIDLAGLVKTIRDELELADAARQREGRAPIFLLSHMDLEVKFAVAESTEAKGGFDLKVVTMGGANAVREEQIHTVKLHFTADPEAIRSGVPGSRAHPDAQRQADQHVVPLDE